MTGRKSIQVSNPWNGKYLECLLRICRQQNKTKTTEFGCTVIPSCMQHPSSKDEGTSKGCIGAAILRALPCDRLSVAKRGRGMLWRSHPWGWLHLPVDVQAMKQQWLEMLGSFPPAANWLAVVPQYDTSIFYSY